MFAQIKLVFKAGSNEGDYSEKVCMQRVLLTCSGKNEIHRLLMKYVQAV